MSALRLSSLAIAAACLLPLSVNTAQAQKEVKPEVVAKIKDALPKAAAAKPKMGRKVLIFTRTKGFRRSGGKRPRRGPAGPLSLCAGNRRGGRPGRRAAARTATASRNTGPAQKNAGIDGFIGCAERP